MGKFKNGILGGFSGTVGSVVGARWRGHDVMRSRPSHKRSKSSEGQLRQMAKVSLVTSVVSPLSDFLTEAYDCVAGDRMAAYHKCMSYNLRNAVDGEYPDYRIAFDRFKLGVGDLLNAENLAAHSDTEGTITFTWRDNSLTGSARTTDRFFTAIHCEESGYWIADFGGVERNAGNCTRNSGGFSGKTVHAYAGFQSADGRFVTTSVYLGKVSVR